MELRNKAAEGLQQSLRNYQQTLELHETPEASCA